MSTIDEYISFSSSSFHSFFLLANCRPELFLDLNGATIKWRSDKSKWKNVFQLSSLFGLCLLLQDQDDIKARQWYEAIKSEICQLVSNLLE
jgi:hypothetical protein